MLAARITIRIDEGCAFDAVVAHPIDREGSVGLFDVERFGVAVAGEAERQVIVAVDDPSIAGFTGKQRELTDGDDASIVIGGAADDIADLIDETEVCALDHALAWTPPLPLPRLPAGRAFPGIAGPAMDVFIQLFGNLLIFVYHCFDRIVIHGYLGGLSRPEQAVHFFRQVVGVAAVTKRC